MSFRALLLVACGGAAGSVARYLMGLALPRAESASFPLGTFLVNLTGCMLIGVFAGFAEHAPWMIKTGWPLLATGICGGFTTFSAFSLESVRLFQAGAPAMAILYASASVIGGMLLCYAGYCVSR